MLFDGTHLNIIIAFLAGFITFFASCFLPLVPVYLAYLSGVSLLSSKHSTLQERWQIFLSALFFVIGFIITFVVLGATFNTLSRYITPYKSFIDKLGGVFFIILGLYLLNIFQPAFLAKEYKLHPHKLKTHKLIYAFLVGVTFAFAWSPCIGPVLGVILFWASRQDTYWQGIKLLTFFGLGLGTPFLLTGLLFEYIHPFLHKNAFLSRVFQKLAGLVILLAGFLLLFDKLKYFSLWLLSLFHISPYSG